MRLKSKVYPNKVILIYYFALLILLVSWKDTSNAPNILLRVTYLGLFFLPLYTKYIQWLPILLTCFYIIASNGFAYTYFPTDLYIYAFLVFIGVLISHEKYRQRFKETHILIFLLLYVSIIDIVNNGKIENITYSLFIILLFFKFADKKSIKLLSYLSISFIAASLVLSILFIINKDMFSQDYAYISDLQRYGWTDPNYFGTVIGIGVICSVIELLKGYKLVYKSLFISTIVLSFIALLLIASRGAILSVAVGVSFLLFFSKIKLRYKILAIASILFLLVFLYNSSYFDLLLYRIESDSGGGSGRTDIWATKLIAFSDGNIFRLLFGHGFDRGIRLGYGKPQGFHNDYIAFLVNYGMLGLIVFLYMFIYPIIKKTQVNRSTIIACVLYLATCSITLEPFSAGRLPYFIFYVYVLALSVSLPTKRQIN